jgi:PII-like signaling protein
MNDGITVTVARVYVTEGEGTHRRIFKRLHDEERVQGVTMFRGIAGFGRSGEVHSADLLDMSLDLPVVIEFFDAPDRVAAVIERLSDLVPPGHVVTFAAKLQ